MIDSVFHFILICLASFRLTRLIVFDKITEFIRRPFHKEVDEVSEDGKVETFIELKGTGIRRFLAELLSCYWCTGFWCSLFLFSAYIVIPAIAEPLIFIFAIAACAALIEAVLQTILEE